MLKFSVLMSVYKNEKPEYLKQALESIVKQTLMPNEIVIIKDGLLTDELDQVIGEYKASYKDLFKIVVFAENRGLGLALRDGVIACSHEYIARMDTDDVCKCSRFERQMEYLEEHPEIVLLGTWIREFSESLLKPDTVMQLPCCHREIKDFAIKRNPFKHSTVIFKKSAIIDCGNYRDFLWFEDYDLWIRIIQKGYQTANLPEYLVNVRAGSDMFARRGGWSYLKKEIYFQNFLFRSKFISKTRYLKNIAIRSLVRMLPNKARILVYKKFLRGSEC